MPTQLATQVKGASKPQQSTRSALVEGLTPSTQTAPAQVDPAANATVIIRKKKDPMDEIHEKPPPDKEPLKAPQPPPRWRRILIFIVNHWTFDTLISVFTLYFASLLASNDINVLIYPENNQPAIQAYTSCQTMLVVFFTMEALLKILAFGIRSRKAKSAEELETIFEHDPNSARQLLTEEQLGLITDTFNDFDTLKVLLPSPHRRQRTA
jgi:hypothetical protein